MNTILSNYIKFRILPFIFLIVFLLANMIVAITTFVKYRETQYHRTLHTLTDSILSIYSNKIKTMKDQMVINLSKSVKYTASKTPVFLDSIRLNIPKMKKFYNEDTHRAIRKKLELIVSRGISQKQNFSICFLKERKCVNFMIASTGLGINYLFLIVFAFAILFAVPLYLFYTQKLVKPFFKLQAIAYNLGIERTNQSIAGPFSIKNMAYLTSEVAEKITEIAEEKTRIFSAISHDLKTPITKAKLYMHKSIPNEYHSTLEKYYSDMEYLLNQIQFYAKRSFYKENYQKINLVDLVDSQCYEYSSNGLKVFFSSNIQSIILYLQRKAFKRVLQNLIDNALKYAGNVKVEVEQNAEHITISFIDEGPGIHPSLLKKIYEPFYRIDQSRNHNIPGSGLGLSIVKEIVQQNHAQLSIKNNIHTSG